MPQTSDVLGIGTLVLVILCFSVGALCLAYVLFYHFRICKNREPLLRDFDSPWIVRTVLSMLFMLWAIGELLRLPWLRRSNWFQRSLDLHSQADICKFHLVWSVGFAEPGLLLTILFTVQASLRSSASSLSSLSAGSSSSSPSSPSATKHFNGRVLTLMILSCVPVFALQLVFAVLSHDSTHRLFGGVLPSYFSRSYEVQSDMNMVLCSYPLLSTLALGLFAVAFMSYFTSLGYKLLRDVINRKLRIRVGWMVIAVLSLLPLHVILLGVSAQLSPSKAIFEVLIFLAFLALLLCVGAAIAVLVVLPVVDATDVFRIFRNRDPRWQPFTSIPLEVFSRPFLEVVSDDDSPRAKRSLLGTVSSAGTEMGSSSKDGSLSFNVVPKDLTLGPGGWLSDVPGSVSSPPTPTVPGRQLIV